MEISKETKQIIKGHHILTNHTKRLLECFVLLVLKIKLLRKEEIEGKPERARPRYGCGFHKTLRPGHEISRIIIC